MELVWGLGLGERAGKRCLTRMETGGCDCHLSGVGAGIRLPARAFLGKGAWMGLWRRALMMGLRMRTLCLETVMRARGL